jgi:hypothetical protein
MTLTKNMTLCPREQFPKTRHRQGGFPRLPRSNNGRDGKEVQVFAYLLL